MAESLTTIENTISRVIEARVAAEWQDSGTPRTPIQYSGVLGLVDATGQIIPAPPTDAAWLRIDIIWGDTEEWTLPTSTGFLNRSTGLIQLTVFAPANQGTVALETYKGYAKAIFSRHQGSGLRCRASRTENLTNEGWLMGVVTTPFEIYESSV